MGLQSGQPRNVVVKASQNQNIVEQQDCSARRWNVHWFDAASIPLHKATRVTVG